MTSLLPQAQVLIDACLHRIANNLQGGLLSRNFVVGSMGSWYNQNGILNAHLTLLRINSEEVIEYIVSLHVMSGRVEASADVCHQNGAILHSIGDFIFESSDDDATLIWLEGVCQTANKGFLKYAADLK